MNDLMMCQWLSPLDDFFLSPQHTEANPFKGNIDILSVNLPDNAEGSFPGLAGVACPNTSIDAPSATIQAKLRMVEDVKQILPALGHLTTKVSHLRSRMVFLEAVNSTAMTTTSELVHNSTISSIEDQLKALNLKVLWVDDDKEGENVIAGGSQPAEIYENHKAAPCSFVKDTLIIFSFSIPIAATTTLMMPSSSVAEATTSAPIPENDPFISDDDDE
ncbi:hypothetical protein L6452_02393 [Arctium lappa]|uniref:Uncharacterized protein n=1 Tax=Arctium lappa TaxID=4217 RepID=A0ACB9FIQ1_ARCLA|nr:hypothetical protein L6452_02393 [Arctium lappa]